MKCHMVKELEPNLDPSLSRRFGTVADEASVKRTVAALEANGIIVLRAPDAAATKRTVVDLIPDGSQVYHGASQTLEVLASPTSSTSPGATTRSDRGSGAWIARRRATRSAGSARRPTSCSG